MEGKMFEQKSSYDYEELLACSRGELFGPGPAAAVNIGRPARKPNEAPSR
jgi:hypothetical protein